MNDEEMGFLPEGYEVPDSSGNYMRLKEGENKFRILTRPVMGWLDFIEKKPARFRMDAKPEKSFDPKKPVRHFWAMVVWNYNMNKIQVFELDKKGVMTTIKGLAKDPDWGSPLNYDLKIVRSGSGFDTEYAVTAIPPKPVDESIKGMFEEYTIDLNKLFEAGGDPFTSVPF